MENKPFGYTYHSHTFRCGHAVGKDEDYAKKAIEGHYQVLGYSDHVMLPGREQPGMRGSYALAQGYFDSVRKLEKKYADKLEIHLAFEAEWYYDVYAAYYHDLLASQTIDYLLLGQHCFLDGDRFVFYGSLSDKADATRHYEKDIIAGIHSHNFIYVAHPDLFMSWYGKWDLLAEECSRHIIKAAKEEAMPLEINLGPSRWGRRNRIGQEIDVAYPCPRFWDLASEAGVTAIFGVDDHDPKELIASPFDWARSFAEKHHIRPIERLSLPFSVPKK